MTLLLKAYVVCVCTLFYCAKPPPLHTTDDLDECTRYAATISKRAPQGHAGVCMTKEHYLELIKRGMVP